MHTRLFSIAAPATRTRGGSGAEAALVSLSDGCEDSLPCSEFQPRCSAGSHAHGSSIGHAYEVDRGDRPGRHQRWTRTRAVIFGDGVAANPRCWCCRPARGPDRRPRCRPRTGPAWVPWRISYSPLIHQMKCYTGLERVLDAAEQASKPGPDLLPLKPLAPSRILGATNVLDHGEVAQAQHPARTAFFSHPDLSRYSRSPSEGDPPVPRVQEVVAFQG
jgi:hypothetical protein